MYDTSFIIMASLIIGMGSILALLIVSLNGKKKVEQALLNVEVYRVNVSAVIDQTIPDLLATIILESFSDYQIIALATRDEGFINDAREMEIRTDLVAKVSERLSDATLDKLSLYYNRENIANIVADKIYITVMNYVVDHNTKYMA